MKLRFVSWLLLLATGAASAVTLRPSVIVYGVIRDSFGLRMGADSALVSAFLGTNEVARTVIKAQPLNANYQLEVNVADPLTATPQTVVPGSQVSIRVRIANNLQPQIGPNTFIAPANGGTVNMNLILGLDTDNDGLPDDWEWLNIQNSGGAISNLSQIGPGTDLDGDGILDGQEFNAGTFAFLPDDQLKMSALASHANSRLSFTFTGVESLNYTVEYTTSLANSQWILCPIALTATGPLATGSVTGSTQPITIYFDCGNPVRFWRLKAAH